MHTTKQGCNIVYYTFSGFIVRPNDKDTGSTKTGAIQRSYGVHIAGRKDAISVKDDASDFPMPFVVSGGEATPEDPAVAPEGGPREVPDAEAKAEGMAEIDVADNPGGPSRRQ